MDPIEDLTNDHRTVIGLIERIERGEASVDSDVMDQIVRELSIHAAAEEVVVYPALGEEPGARNLLGTQLQEHQLVKELLAGIERSHGADRATLLDALAAYVRHHVEVEEGTFFPWLREALTEDQLRDMGSTLADVKRTAPTHPHPHAPNRPPAILPAAAVASLLDRVRDAIAARAGSRGSR